MPIAYTYELIPANLTHIPTPETAKSWPHLKHLGEHIAPQMECEIELLTGYNCPTALIPKEVVTGEENQPFMQKTDLGWSTVSYSDPRDHEGDALGVSCRITARQVTPEPKQTVKLRGKVYYVCNTRIKETITPNDVIKVLEYDFSKQIGKKATVSQKISTS